MQLKGVSVGNAPHSPLARLVSLGSELCYPFQYSFKERAKVLAECACASGEASDADSSMCDQPERSAHGDLLVDVQAPMTLGRRGQQRERLAWRRRGGSCLRSLASCTERRLQAPHMACR